MNAVYVECEETVLNKFYRHLHVVKIITSLNNVERLSFPRVEARPAIPLPSLLSLREATGIEQRTSISTETTG